MKYDKMILGNDFSVTMDCDITQTNNNVTTITLLLEHLDVANL